MNFSGYASLTETPYDMGPYDETVARGAFRVTLASKPDVQLLINHGAGGSGMPLARTKSGTLRLSEDDMGLRMDADLDDDDPDVQSLTRKMQRGDIDQCSFSFHAVRQKWSDDYSSRRILEASIHRGDVSVVNMAASPTTSASIRSAVIRSAGRSAIPDRKKLAGEIGDLAVVEMRSFTLDGERFNLRAAGDNCNRCDGEGTIVLSGKTVTCPTCKGSGGPEGNADTSEDDDSEDDDSERSADIAMLALARVDIARSRGRIAEAIGKLPGRGISSNVPARLRLEALRYPPKGNQ